MNEFADVKAPDIVESWKWEHGEKIIERLLARPSRTISEPVSETEGRPVKDIYYFAARRCAAMREARLHVERLMRRAG